MVLIWTGSIFEKQERSTWKAGIDCETHLLWTYLHCHLHFLLCCLHSFDNGSSVKSNVRPDVLDRYLFAGGFLNVGYPTILTLRNYFQNLDIMKQQLLEISFDTTKSSCCEKNHRILAASNGECEPILCDRKVVKECVNFEQHARSEVKKRFWPWTSRNVSI